MSYQNYPEEFGWRDRQAWANSNWRDPGQLPQGAATNTGLQYLQLIRQLHLDYQQIEEKTVQSLRASW